MSKIIDIQQESLINYQSLYLKTCFNLPNYNLNIFEPSDGQGYTEIYDFDRLCVSKGKYWLNHPKEIKENKERFSLSLTILLSGTQQIIDHLTNQTYTFDSPTLILKRGTLDLQTIYAQEKKQISFITLYFNKSLLTLLEPSQSANPLICFFMDHDNSKIKTLDIPQREIFHHAQYLLNLPTAETMLDLLYLEGATLELISLLLKKNQQECKISLPIKKAIHILENEFEEKITIRYLSKQVGMNECYLKRIFKETTGYTIGNYLLNIRMKYAQTLLKEGFSIENVTSKIGYCSSQHFKRIYEQYYGYQP
ncbi:helix-turn-helix domain-containing protein [Acinetobacter sp. B5B]|uniref:helix-turn-helix domain-containing protein n=1 Tax=Acinetobacter baretiae TaxID=2605383 RepID=UPI0018C22DF9|nr:AraC family transcriptional regulator [Acinetobacter baretiae]MBF7681788.1 helix-turn-helix domain-containing protein [Acinetobacter baretiae]